MPRNSGYIIVYIWRIHQRHVQIRKVLNIQFTIGRCKTIMFSVSSVIFVWFWAHIIVQCSSHQSHEELIHLVYYDEQ